jgi:hypothetical protein
MDTPSGFRLTTSLARAFSIGISVDGAIAKKKASQVSPRRPDTADSAFPP